MGQEMGRFRRLIFWEFPRGSWQYDVVVLLILAFIFVTPRTLFKDQPRPRQIVEIQASGPDRLFYLEADLLDAGTESVRLDQARRLLKDRTEHPGQLRKVEPVFDGEKEIIGWHAYVKR
jgi:hypothetical protein